MPEAMGVDIRLEAGGWNPKSDGKNLFFWNNCEHIRKRGVFMHVVIAVGPGANALVARAVRDVLAEAEILLADSGQETEKVVALRHPDVLVLYGRLESENRSVAQLTRLGYSSPGTRVIFLQTGVYSDPAALEAIRAARDLGIRDVLIDEAGDGEIEANDFRGLLQRGRSAEEANRWYERVLGPSRITLAGSSPRGGDVGIRHGQLITVVSPNSGVGKTTVAAELLEIAVADKWSSLGLDFNLVSADLGYRLGFPGTSPGLEALVNRSESPDALLRRRGSLIFLPGISDEYIGTMRDVDLGFFQGLMQDLRPGLDLTVVDTSCVFDDSAMVASLEAADAIVLVAEPEMGRLVKFRRRLEWILRSGIEPGKLHLVVNKAGASAIHTGELAQAIGQGLSWASLTTIAQNIEVYRRVVKERRPVALREPPDGPWHGLFRSLTGLPAPSQKAGFRMHWWRRWTDRRQGLPS